MMCFSPVGFGVWLMFRALALRRSSQPILNLLDNAEKAVVFKTSLPFF